MLQSQNHTRCFDSNRVDHDGFVRVHEGKASKVQIRDRCLDEKTINDSDLARKVSEIGLLTTAVCAGTMERPPNERGRYIDCFYILRARNHQ